MDFGRIYIEIPLNFHIIQNFFFRKKAFHRKGGGLRQVLVSLDSVGFCFLATFRRL
jgi:hypothetical protein